jgi:hypothetical protein
VRGVLFKPAKWKDQVSAYTGQSPPKTRKLLNKHIIKDFKRGKGNLRDKDFTDFTDSLYATGGNKSINHNKTLVGNVEEVAHNAGVSYK